MSATRKLIFPAETSSSNISADFFIEDAVGILKFTGLKAGDRLLIESEFGATECDTSWIPTTFCCKQMSTSACSTHMIIPIPGKFRAVLVNEDNDHIGDPTYFEDVKITFEKHKIYHDISSFFQLCC